jgi:hypothetical protein
MDHVAVSEFLVDWIALIRKGMAKFVVYMMVLTQ